MYISIKKKMIKVASLLLILTSCQVFGIFNKYLIRRSAWEFIAQPVLKPRSLWSCVRVCLVNNCTAFAMTDNVEDLTCQLSTNVNLLPVNKLISDVMEIWSERLPTQNTLLLKPVDQTAIRIDDWQKPSDFDAIPASTIWSDNMYLFNIDPHILMACNGVSKECETLRPGFGTWESAANLLYDSELSENCNLNLGGEVMLLGSDIDEYDKTQIYSIAKNEWRAGPPMPGKMHSFSCTSYDPYQGLLVGGQNVPSYDYLAEVYRFDSRSQSFSLVGTMEDPSKIMACGSTTGASGKPLVICTGSAGEIRKTYQFDTETNTLLRKPDWDVTFSVAWGRGLNLGGRLTIIRDYDEGAYEFVEEVRQGSHWVSKPELSMSGFTVAVVVDTLELT